MLPDLWGPAAWKTIHAITLSYPLDPTMQEKIYYRDFLYGLQYVLPCAKCGINMGHNLQMLPLTDDVMSTRDNLVNWAVDLHNMVNLELGKPVLVGEQITAALADMFQKPAFEPRPSNHAPLVFALVAVIVAVIALILYCKRGRC